MERRRANRVVNQGEGKYFLDPGYVYFTKKSAVISTVLGSCVSVCLWDTKLRYGGMNHFFYPRSATLSEATPRYGNAATHALLAMMLQAGCETCDLVGHIIGGGNPAGEEWATMEKESVMVAKRVLQKKQIAIVAEDVGGKVGRKVVFDTASGHVAVAKVYSLRQEDWLPNDSERKKFLKVRDEK